MKTLLSAPFIARWRDVLMRRAPDPLLPAETAAELEPFAAAALEPFVPPASPALRAVSPTAAGIAQGPAPVGPSTGTLVSVSCYLPFDVELSPYVTALVSCGYPSLEVRQAQHADTKSRISASGRVPHPNVTEAEVRAVIAKALGELETPVRLDVQTWPTW